MLLTEFPNLQWLKNEIESSFASERAWDGRKLPKPEWPNVIINAKTSEALRDNIKGPLSIFSNFSGESKITLGRRVFKVGSADFLISNADQRYTLEIDHSHPIETFNIHFSESFRKEALGALQFSNPDLLDPTLKEVDGNFVNRIQPKSKTLIYLMHQLRGAGDSIHFEETLYKIVLHLVASEKDLKETFEKIPLQKRSSRVEIMKRLLIAMDYLQSFSDCSLTLAELASVSNLSKFHFLRLFKDAFKLTPHQYIIKIRIEKAKAMLLQNTYNVKDIAFTVGFQNSSSFSRLFKQQVGVYPSQFRSGC